MTDAAAAAAYGVTLARTAAGGDAFVAPWRLVNTDDRQGEVR